jgi:hypothetical protein
MNKLEEKNEDEELKEFLLMQYRNFVSIIRWIEKKYDIVPYEERALDQALKIRSRMKPEL